MRSNRSLCWANLQEATFALYDAEACVRLTPNWPKAHYREGAAWMLLKVCKILSLQNFILLRLTLGKFFILWIFFLIYMKNYMMASGAFAKACRLDPRNVEADMAYK